MKLFIISTTIKGWNPTSWAIRTGSRGEWSHSIVGFGTGDQPEIYYESRSNRVRFISKYHGTVDKTGVRGPKPIARLYQWHDENPKKHRFKIQHVKGVTTQECHEAIEMLDRAAGYITYDGRQIIQNARYMLTGNLGRRKSINPLKWTCSETAFKALPMRMQVEAGLGSLFMYDWISPSGKLYGLVEMVDMLNDARPIKGK